MKTTHKLLSTAAAVCLIFGTTTSVFAQTDFAGSLNTVSISDAAGTNKPPTASFTFTQDGDTFTFDASGSFDSDGNIAGYKWDFGSGNVSNGVTASLPKESVTDFLATLTVIDNAGGVSIYQENIKAATETGFYWSMDTLPSTSILSDNGDVTVTKFKTAAISIPGVTGNGLHQEGYYCSYYFPMTTLPASKGTVELYVKHDNPASASDATNRVLFRSTNQGKENSLYAYTYKNTIYFYLIDSTNTLHRVYKTDDSWQVGRWYKYAFSWDSDIGYLSINRDDTTVIELNTTPWVAPNWSSQDLFIGYLDPVGGFDELRIY